MTNPYTSQPGGEAPQGFSYVPGSSAPVIAAPYPHSAAGYPALAPSARPGTVTGAIVLLWVMAGLTLIGGLVFTVFILLASQAPRSQTTGTTTTVVPTSSIVSAILLLVLLATYSALMMVAAIKIPKKSDLGRVLALVLMGFFVFSNVTYLVVSIGGIFTTGPWIISIIVVMVVLLLVAAMPAVVIALLSVKKTVSWFYDHKPVMPSGPQSMFTVPADAQVPQYAQQPPQYAQQQHQQQASPYAPPQPPMEQATQVPHETSAEQPTQVPPPHQS